MTKALITGVSGQTGSYLAELLLGEGCEVAGLVRRSSAGGAALWRIEHLLSVPNFRLVEGDLCDISSLRRAVHLIQPDEVFNLGAQSFVAASFNEPEHTWDVTAGGALRLLEVIREMAPENRPRFYQASSSEMYGSSVSRVKFFKKKYSHLPSWLNPCCPEVEEEDVFQDEDTPFAPNSPYAIAKLAAHHAVRVYREAYGVHAVSGISFNHESPRRGPEFVTRKITRFVGRYAVLGPKAGVLRLGNLDARRDWSHARDVAQAIVWMTRASRPADYVVASGEAHSVRDFLEAAFKEVGVTGPLPVTIDPALFRPCEVPYLRGRPDRIKQALGWERKTSFAGLVKEMVGADLERAKRQNAP